MLDLLKCGLIVEDWPDFSHLQRNSQGTSNAAAQISYSIRYEELMTIFWIIYEREEFSLRVLDLISQIVEECEANYTVWNYRLRCVKALMLLEEDGGDNLLKNELLYIRKYTIETPKNYQLWRYREEIISLYNFKEISFEWEDLQMVLIEEEKNYHAWQYRIWLLGKDSERDWKDELKFVTECILRDPYNNSAWTMRYYLQDKCFNFPKEEIEFSLKIGYKYPNNKSVLNYLTKIETRTKEDSQEIGIFIANSSA